MAKQDCPGPQALFNLTLLASRSIRLKKGNIHGILRRRACNNKSFKVWNTCHPNLLFRGVYNASTLDLFRSSNLAGLNFKRFLGKKVFVCKKEMLVPRAYRPTLVAFFTEYWLPEQKAIAPRSLRGVGQAVIFHLPAHHRFDALLVCTFSMAGEFPPFPVLNTSPYNFGNMPLGGNTI